MSGIEQRKAPRLRILDSFSVFVNVPKKSEVRLDVHNLSSTGISMDLDTEGESVSDFPIQVGEQIGIELFLNPTLSIPLRVKIMRLEEKENGVRTIGAEFVDGDRESTALGALQSFVKLLDDLSKAKGTVVHV